MAFPRSALASVRPCYTRVIRNLSELVTFTEDNHHCNMDNWRSQLSLNFAFPLLLKQYLFLLFFSLINSSFSLLCKTLVFMKFLISFGSPYRMTWVTQRGLSLILGYSLPPLYFLDSGEPLCSVPEN